MQEGRGERPANKVSGVVQGLSHCPQNAGSWIRRGGASRASRVARENDRRIPWQGKSDRASAGVQRGRKVDSCCLYGRIKFSLAIADATEEAGRVEAG